MFEDVKHRYGGATFGGERSLGQRRADGGNSGPAPGDVGGIERKIEADDIPDASLSEHLKEQAAAASYVEYESCFLRLAQRSLDEAKMIAQHEAAVDLFQPIGRIGVGDVPVARRIIISQLQRMRLRIEPDQAAVAAFDDAENFVGGPVQAVGAGKQQAGFAMAAGRTRVRRRDGTGR
jgi:hypothetical protein